MTPEEPTAPTQTPAKPTRKIVQIAVLAADESLHACIYALCDDGTVWVAGAAHGKWVQMPAIPQQTG
jgi:hypothetical protein